MIGIDLPSFVMYLFVIIPIRVVYYMHHLYLIVTPRPPGSNNGKRGAAGLDRNMGGKTSTKSPCESESKFEMLWN